MVECFCCTRAFSVSLKNLLHTNAIVPLGTLPSLFI